MHAADIRRSMDMHFDRLQEKVAKNQVLQIQQQIQKGIQPNAPHSDLRTPRVPNPSLLIALPTATTRVRDRAVQPFRVQLRLFFLCESSTHTTTKYTKVRHEIHLGKRERYDIAEPAKFFGKHGP
ncbi:hypothetical protein BC939DRAFT_502643 [Gamsiella multidivaricata]|uniref:uncharacterized protein n=1 Tax=Gamsiella multidivaricata TaxID=101098 RepID=UPI00221F1637|nr:uncharacterized protein BC939DRAFT_502643 [Gamsiella multidivaricata]KAI7824660.1 hypothetical protein BC939DRAFT_502643 [Gamsiella multidivaricata]